MTNTEALGEVIVALGGEPEGDSMAELIHQIAELIDEKPKAKASKSK